MTRHIIVASYDGIATHYCGVGTIVRNTIRALEEISKTEDIKVSLAFISADPNGKVFNKECYKSSLDLIKKTNGYLIPLSNGTNGFDEWDMWRSFPEWENVAVGLSSALNLILDDKEENIVMLHDTPFLLFSKFKKQMFGKKFKSLYLPHSSGLNHVFGNEEWREKRVETERSCFSVIKKDTDSKIIATGDSFGAHLSKDYGVFFGQNDYLRNGLYFEQYSSNLQNKLSNKDLKKFNINIPDSAKLIFSWGRCSIAKGFKELIEAWGKIENQLPNHYLVLQAPNNSGENNYFEKLKESSILIPRIILINDFDPEIWKSVLRCVNTDVVCLPSLMDPNPHTPIEAKFFCRGMNYVIIASEKDGVKDTFYENECVLINPYDIESFSRLLLSTTKISSTERKTMINSNNKTIHNYDYISNFKKLLNYLK